MKKSNTHFLNKNVMSIIDVLFKERQSIVLDNTASEMYSNYENTVLNSLGIEDVSNLFTPTLPHLPISANKVVLWDFGCGVGNTLVTAGIIVGNYVKQYPKRYPNLETIALIGLDKNHIATLIARDFISAFKEVMPPYVIAGNKKMSTETAIISWDVECFLTQPIGNAKIAFTAMIVDLQGKYKIHNLEEDSTSHIVFTNNVFTKEKQTLLNLALLNLFPINTLFVFGSPYNIGNGVKSGLDVLDYNMYRKTGKNVKYH